MSKLWLGTNFEGTKRNSTYWTESSRKCFPTVFPEPPFEHLIFPTLRISFSFQSYFPKQKRNTESIIKPKCWSRVLSLCEKSAQSKPPRLGSAVDGGRCHAGKLGGLFQQKSWPYQTYFDWHGKIHTFTTRFQLLHISRSMEGVRIACDGSSTLRRYSI